ncbi:hypothetical protein [Synechococcus sp. N19]|uniref:hypothetical protein n=1 Tax=Synechococcus sp. N19 TaxID=2575512 RepID=UPI0010BF0885|nr:hypothetical protein [Synechococcus sp. N19]
MNQLLIAILFLAAALDAPARADSEADWRKVDEASSYMGQEMSPPKFVDINSALLTSDGYIVFRQIAPIPTYEMRNGKVYANKSKRNFENRWQYYGIDCKEKHFASSKQYPKFKSSARHYGKDVVHNGNKVYNNTWPRNVEKLLCGKTGIRSIPHTVGQILFLNCIEGKNSNIKPLPYDKAVMLGVIK